MANKITLVMPLYPYSRQDRKDSSRVPISASILANLLENTGLDRIISVDLHATQIQGFFKCPVDNLYTINLVKKKLYNLYNLDNALIKKNYVLVAPDSGSVRRTLKFAKEMKLNTVIMHKQRDYSQANCIDKVLMRGERVSIENKTALILDDMADTFGTASATINSLVIEHGAHNVICVVTHGILSGPAISRLTDSVISKVIVCNTINLDESKKFSKLEIINVAEVFGESIKRIVAGDSLSSMFKNY